MTAFFDMFLIPIIYLISGILVLVLWYIKFKKKQNPIKNMIGLIGITLGMMSFPLAARIIGKEYDNFVLTAIGAVGFIIVMMIFMFGFIFLFKQQMFYRDKYEREEILRELLDMKEAEKQGKIETTNE